MKKDILGIATTVATPGVANLWPHNLYWEWTGLERERSFYLPSFLSIFTFMEWPILTRSLLKDC